MTDHIRRVDDDGVITLTFTRDEKLNAVDDDMLQGEAARRRGVLEDQTVDDYRALVGSTDPLGALLAVVDGGALRADEAMMLTTLASQGPCLGIGIELGVSCDFRLCSERAVFRLPEITNLAVIPGSGGISRLTRLIGPHWARWLAMAAQQVDARQALSIGLVHQVLPDDGFAEAVQAFARGLAGISREALGLAKLAIDAAASADRATARDVDRIANTLLLLSDEHSAAVEAFQARKNRR